MRVSSMANTHRNQRGSVCAALALERAGGLGVVAVMRVECVAVEAAVRTGDDPTREREQHRAF